MTSIFHLPGAKVGDPRCNCVSCERNRDEWPDCGYCGKNGHVSRDCPDAEAEWQKATGDLPALGGDCLIHSVPLRGGRCSKCDLEAKR